MEVGETNPILRRLFFELTLDDGVTPATDADVSPPADTIKVSKNGAAFANSAGTFARIAANLYYYELTAGELVRGFVAGRFSRAGYGPMIAVDFVGSVFVVGETDTAYLRYPVVIFGDDPQPPIPATGATVTTASDLQNSVSGASFANSAGTLHEVGFGLYYYQGVVPDAAARARLLVKYASTGFALAAVLIPVEPPAGGSDATPPAIGTVSPLAETAPGAAGGFPALYNDAKDVPIVIPVVDVSSPVGFVVLSILFDDRTTWETVYAGRPLIDGDTAYRAGYAINSTLSGSGAPGVGFTFSVRHDFGWPARNGLALRASIDTKAVDSKGNVLA